MKWRVERAGSPGHYLPGWIVRSGEDGLHVDTWDQAMVIATRYPAEILVEACS